MNATTERTLAQRIRRWVVGIIIASFSLAAISGVITLLSGSLDDTTIKVLGTTALTGLFSVAVLCGAALVGKLVQWFGWVTMVVSIVTLSLLLYMLWAEPSWSDTTWQSVVTLCVLTGAFAISSLLLLLVASNLRSVRTLLGLTLAFIGIGVFLTALAIWDAMPDDEDFYWRITGVVWIIAALGIVTLPVISLVLAAGHKRVAVESTLQFGGDYPSGQVAYPAANLSEDSLKRIAEAASAQGISPDELIARVLS